MNTYNKVLNFITIRNKRKITENNDELIDLSETTFSNKTLLTYQSTPILTSKEVTGRPHIISKIVYKNEDHTDLLCHYNNISNPFMIPANYLLYIPDLKSMLNNIKDNNKDNTSNKSKEKLNKKASVQDKNRFDALVAKAKALGVDNTTNKISTPNMADEGTNATTAVGGEIILGTNTTDTRCNRELSTTQTRSEQIKKAIKESL